MQRLSTKTRQLSKLKIASEMPSVGIGARSFNIDRSSHRTADIDTYYQHFNIETTYKKQTKIK